MVERSRREGGRASKAAQITSQRPSRSSVTKHHRSADARAASKHAAPGGRFASAPKKVRIIGGTWKRTLLPVPDAAGLRPTPDRVRETVFNWIEHFVSDLTMVRGLDLFAGTGALGFELASRGARHVTLVEHNQRLADQLQHLQRKLAADRIEIVAADALAAASRWPGGSFEVIFVDPPYDSGLLQPALRTAARLSAQNGLIYVEHRDPIDESLIGARRLQVVRASRAGHVFFYLLRQMGETSSDFVNNPPAMAAGE